MIFGLQRPGGSAPISQCVLTGSFAIGARVGQPVDQMSTTEIGGPRPTVGLCPRSDQGGRGQNL
jgi:hypothetical protein